MTTLPQTTPIRLPRPNSSVPMQAPMTLPGQFAGAAAAAGPQMSAADVWRVIRANIWLILVMLVIGGVSGWFLNQYLPKKFTATGYVVIQPQGQFDPIKGMTYDNSAFAIGIEQRTQVKYLQHESLYSKALQTRPELRETAWFQSFGGLAQLAKKNLTENFAVAPVIETRLIQISMTCFNKEDTAKVVTEIVTVYLDEQRKEAGERQRARIRALNDQKTTITLKQSNTASDLMNLTAKLSIDGGASSANATNNKELELGDHNRRRIELINQKNIVDNALNNAITILKNGGMPTQIEDIVNADPNVSRLRAGVDQLSMDLEGAAAKYGPNNTNIIAMNRQMEIVKRRLAEAINDKRASAQENYLGELKSRSDALKASLASEEEQISAIKSDIGELSNSMAKYYRLRDEDASYRETLAAINKELDAIEQRKQQYDLGLASWYTLPQVPDYPTFPKLPQTMGMCIFGALALALGIAFLRELTDTSVRSPRDIQRIGQMSILGMIPHESDDPQSAGARMPLVIFEAPHSLMAEQFRQVRTRLQHTASLDTTRSILVTSPSPGDGKSTVACNIATGLALNGRRILLVDANFRRPDLHRIFGITNDSGFSDALNSIENFESSVRETQIPNLSIMASGPRPTNPTELLESQLLIDFIERALEEYDHVVFDSGPMLFVSDSIALAPRVDGVVTVVRASRNSRGVVQRMRDGLKQVKAEHLGIVLNGVRNVAGGYYGRNVKTYYEYQNGNV